MLIYDDYRGKVFEVDEDEIAKLKCKQIRQIPQSMKRELTLKEIYDAMKREDNRST